ncbi:MAG TPA: FKBP-type peptidyl-prolyl cis-trans isomerase [Gemmatimonadaceae bacterium]|nr:FKBP-type peptidyl-prolyl cis-trans isomerase [Gemmatimonadaceae bacterium]
MKTSLALTLALGFVTAVACNNDVAGLGPPSDPAKETFAPSLGVDLSQMTKMSNGVYYQDLVVGPSTADSVYSKTASVKITYAGYLKDGTLFDSGTGATLDLASLIVGFRTGMTGMKVGGKRRLVIPSELGYDGRAQKNLDNSIKIPRQSTLIFDIQLLDVTQIAT